MASASDVRDVRALTDEQDEAIYSDDDLSHLIDSLGVTGAIHKVWEEKAARFSGLVNVSEAGSSISIGQLYQNAMSQADYWHKREIELSPSSDPTSRPRVKRITRND